MLTFLTPPQLFYFYRMKHLSFMVAIALLWVGCQPQPQTDPATSPASLLFFNGPMYTLEGGQGTAEAVLTQADTIVYVGTLAEAKKRAFPHTQDIDLQGKTLTPGFIDSHAHFMGIGKWQYELNLLGTSSFEAVLDSVQAATKRIPKGTWILGRGWHQSKWDSMPTPLVRGFQVHDALTAISPDHPVYLRHASGHAGYANAAAMRLAHIDDNTPNPDGGEIFRDAQGKATGIFNENAMFLITERIPEPDAVALRAHALLAQKTCLEAGITGFHDAGADSITLALYQQLIEEDNFHLRLYAMLDGWDTTLLQLHMKAGPTTSPLLTVRSIKLYADGALGSRGAWLLKPYKDMPNTTGHARMDMDDIGSVARQALQSGFQVCVHAIGDRANREVLDQYEAAFAQYPEVAKDARFRIEHAQHLHPDDIPRFGEMGVIASVQGVHHASDRPWAIDRLGIRRIKAGAYAWQKLIETGATVINGTDSPVEPVSAVACFYASVSRKTLAGEPDGGYEADMAMTRQQALATYTRDAAYGAFQEAQKGTLKPGKWADFTIFSQDIMTVPESQILDTQVQMTVVGGKVKFRKGGE